MKTRVFRISSLLVGPALLLALVLTLGASAQGRQTAARPTPVSSPNLTAGQLGLDGEPMLPPAGAAGAPAVDVALGEPGLSYRYVKTLGETEVAYFEDSSHINYPWGIGTDGTSVWIAEVWGGRALKFKSDGTFIIQIGTAGLAAAEGIGQLSDVAVDGSGNVWLVDGEAHHILEYDAGGAFVRELGQAWDCSSADDRFCWPRGIAFDGAGNMYASDLGNARVQILDSAGGYIATLGETGVPGPGNYQFDEPEHVAVFAGELYVADSVNSRIQIFDISNPSSPTYVATIGVTGEPGDDNAHLNCPTGVALDDANIHVADSCNARIQVFDRLTRTYVATIGTGWGSGNFEFDIPTDVALDAMGNLYVADLNNMRVQQFDTNWEYARTYGTTRVPYLTDGYHYNEPNGIAVDTLGNTFITEWRGYRLVKLNSAGVFQWAAGEAGMWGSDDEHFGSWMSGDGPIAVAADGSGGAYVADTSNHRIVKCSSTGQCGTFAGVPGEAGSDNNHFDSPSGVAVDAGGSVYVGDRGNHRVQKCTSQGSCSTFAGITGEPGSDVGHFNGPTGVTVDAGGSVYVADGWNHRLQKFSSGGVWQMQLGTTEECGDDFAHLCEPRDVAVDGAGRIFVADSYNNRVQVFDASGRYLTSIGGWSGTGTSQMRYVPGVDVDALGNVYVVDDPNHRVQVFALGVPGWLQVNVNGFGDRQNKAILALAPLGGQLYAGTSNTSQGGAHLWRWQSGGWSPVTTNGFGDPTNYGIGALVEFQANLYAATWNLDLTNGTTTGAQIWRSADGNTWDQIALPDLDPTNWAIRQLAEFGGALYASTGSWTTDHGGEVWSSSDGLNWTQAGANGFGDANNNDLMAMAAFEGHLYVATGNSATGTEMWRTDGSGWDQVNADGFGDAGNTFVMGLAGFDGALYAGTYRWGNPVGGEIWRCLSASGCDEPADWQQVLANGFGNADNYAIRSLIEYEGRLYAAAANRATGMEVWRSENGTDWAQVGFAGFGDSNNWYAYLQNSLTVFDGRLLVGTGWNNANGGEVWTMQHQVFLPLVMRNH